MLSCAKRDEKIFQDNMKMAVIILNKVKSNLKEYKMQYCENILIYFEGCLKLDFIKVSNFTIIIF